MKRHIPNFLTLLNLLSGTLGIYFVFQGNLFIAAYAIWLGAFFDFLDGFTARLLKVSSPIGKELDSLADLVTFGLLPAFIMMNLIIGEPPYFRFAPLIIALFAALRLAKFNIDTRQTSSFRGMPTPSVAFFVSGLPFWLETNRELFSLPVVLIISIVLALLMVIPIRLVALKFTNYRFFDNWQRYSLVILGFGLLLFMGPKSFPVIISMYVGLSLVTRVKETIN